MWERTYIAIDLKTFYASVECIERGLDPLNTNLVVADPTRTEKTICLAVSPALKEYGISGRARLFEVVSRVNEVNRQREKRFGKSEGSSFDKNELSQNGKLALSYIVAPPQMAKYMAKSSEIYSVYLKYVAPEDIHVYSIDEVFIDATEYLKLYGLSAEKFTEKLIGEVFSLTGITATAGIGTNLYLAKVAMDIVAKHIKADKNGVRIAKLDEMSYRKQLWNHRPITDFWRVGAGYAKKLEKLGIVTMGDVARCSLKGDEDYPSSETLYKIFGVNAELLIDHAWGYESCKMEHIKAYRAESSSVSSGQVLQRPYTIREIKVIIKEMADDLASDLFKKGLVTDRINLSIGYDTENLAGGGSSFEGETVLDRFGRKLPKPVQGTEELGEYTSLPSVIIEKATCLAERILDKSFTVRRLSLTALRVIGENEIPQDREKVQLDMFSDYLREEEEREEKTKRQNKENSVREAVEDIRKKYGKNSLFRGVSLREEATQRERNGMIGGHKA